MIACKIAEEQGCTAKPGKNKRKQTERDFQERIERLRRTKRLSCLDRLSPEAREFILSYKGPEVSGSKNKNRLFTVK